MKLLGAWTSELGQGLGQGRGAPACSSGNLSAWGGSLGAWGGSLSASGGRLGAWVAASATWGGCDLRNMGLQRLLHGVAGLQVHLEQRRDDLHELAEAAVQRLALGHALA